MKKRSLVFSLLLLFLFASCGGNRWSCKKRFCITPDQSTPITTNDVILNDICIEKEL